MTELMWPGKLYYMILQHHLNLKMLEMTVSMMPREGLVMEFGVSTGGTIKRIANKTDRTVYGFDWFQGLPEDWRDTDPKGIFACEIPKDLPPNVELVVGKFEDTLPEFFKQHDEKIAFAHIDCDLYKSTATVLNEFKGRLKIGSMIAFDEIFCPVGCFDHEHRAFYDFLGDTGVVVNCIGRQSTQGATFEVAYVPE